MPRRLHQTLADYVVIAISPALIMLLVGSLVFFLLRVFYQGEFPARLHWVMGCFVFAAVLIGRISIEEGYEKAAIYGAALALAVGVASNRFMEYQGTWIDTFSWPINFALIGVIWWCAHKLTWDCTVIDDSQDASGEGLLQIAGLEKAPGARSDEADERRLEGTTTRDVPASYWQRYVQNQHRPHAPGVWVVYFSLAALPLFGIGAWFIPAGDVWGRRYVFWLLCVYVASGLALLVTTSFLGLRRYLRQRRIEMPTLMANLWLGTGAAIIVVLLALAALLPRPNAEYAVSELPLRLGSPDQDASKIAPLKRDGTKDEQPAPAAAEKPPDDPTDEQPPKGEGNQPQGEAEGENASATESAESKATVEGDEGKAKSEKEQQGERSGQDEAREKNEPSSQREGQSRLAEAIKKREEEEAAKRDAQRKAADEQAADAEPSPSTPSTQQIVEPLISPLMQLLKWAIYALFALAVLYSLWRYWPEVVAAIRSFLRELGEWWQALWGGRRDYRLAPDEVPEITIPPSPFASFADPFAGGTAAQASPEELVRYSFEAFEAWSREHGCQREPDQTPHELARDVAKLHAFIAVDARRVAELYARAAYARGELPANAREHLRALWEKMSVSAAPRASRVETPQVWP
jgi:hypothetical protein